jgi:hypothetical protein
VKISVDFVPYVFLEGRNWERVKEGGKGGKRKVSWERKES